MSDDHVDRREFAHRLALGGSPVCRWPPVRRRRRAADPPGDQAERSPSQLILELVQRQYPDGLKEEHLAAIRKDIEAFLLRSRVLSAFPLVNADEPAFEFAAYRKDEH